MNGCDAPDHGWANDQTAAFTEKGSLVHKRNVSSVVVTAERSLRVDSDRDRSSEIKEVAPLMSSENFEQFNRSASA